MSYQQLWRSLLPEYDEREARAVVSWLLDVCFQLSQTDIVCGALEQLSDADHTRLQAMMSRLQEGEPVQYVAGVADFGERLFHVRPGVLIPRPETFELCQWVKENYKTHRTHKTYKTYKTHESYEGPRILDIGTGSGCIACTLALDVPGAQVTAWDISDEALAVARDNANRLGADVEYLCQDTLCPPADVDHWHVIVSNPPYVCQRERRQMEPRVLCHEPALALFVPDDDPLLFYRAIGHYAIQALHRGGRLFFELNASHAAAAASMLRRQGFAAVELRRDQFGKDRFLQAVKP